MSSGLTTGEQNLFLLDALIPANEHFYIWAYSAQIGCINTSCPDEDRGILDQCFRLSGGLKKVTDYLLDQDRTHPLIIGSSFGLQWAAVPDHRRTRELAIVIGPVFYSAPVEEQLYTALRPFISQLKKPSFPADVMRIAPQLPVMSYAVFTRYVLLVHNTLNEQQLGLDSLTFGNPENENIRPRPAEVRNRSKVYLAEQAMLQMVRDGDINYQNVFQNAISISAGVPILGKESLRKAKTNVIVFTSLVCRAAMEGGLSPEVSYSLGDSYIQAAEDCRDSGELAALAHAMYHDFIFRVHQLHANPGYSHAVQKCCDYITLNTDKKIRICDLADLVGYTEYYLTEKFKKETGKSVSTYIREVKIERARLMLETTDLTVQEIAERLAFNTPNYFIQRFKEMTGCTPIQYRESLKIEKKP